MGLDQTFEDIHSVIPALKQWNQRVEVVGCKGDAMKPAAQRTPQHPPQHPPQHTPSCDKFHGVAYNCKSVDAMFSALPRHVLTECLDKLTSSTEVARLCSDLSCEKSPSQMATSNSDVLKTFLDDFCNSLGAENVDPNVNRPSVTHIRPSPRPSPCSSPLLSADQLQPKPAVSYLRIIAQSILQSAQGRVLLNDIYAYVLRNYPYYEHRKSAWRNSIRHNLSVNECFSKDGRAPTGRGHYWRIHAECLEKFAAGDFSRRPNTGRTTSLQSVRAQALHLNLVNSDNNRITDRGNAANGAGGDGSRLRMLTGGKRTAQVYGGNRCEFRGQLNLGQHQLHHQQQQQQQQQHTSDFKQLQFQYQPVQNLQQHTYANNFNGFNSEAAFVRC